MSETILFEKTYTELQDFLEKSDYVLKKKYSKTWKKIRSAIGLIAIKKIQHSEHKYLNTNDYLKNIIDIKEYPLNKKILNDREYYEIFKYLHTNLKKNKNYKEKIINKNFLKIEYENYTIYTYIDELNITNNSNNVRQSTLTLKFYTSHLKKIFNNRYELINFIESKENLKLITIYLMLKLLTLRKNEIKQIDTKHLKFLKENGYVVIENYFNSKVIERLRNKTYQISKNQLENNSAYIYGNGKLQRIYNLIGKSILYNQILADNNIKIILDFFFDRNTLHQKYYLSSYQANILFPGADEQILHTDLALPEPLPKWPVRLNININLDKFDKNNGSTIVYPRSHLIFKKPNKNFKGTKFLKIEAPPGSLIVWSGHIWHKSSENSTNKPRAALLACFSASYMREIALEENYFFTNTKSTLNKLPQRIREYIGIDHGIKKSA